MPSHKLVQQLTLTRLGHLVVCAAVAIVVLVRPAVAFNEPDGFGKAKFGMKGADVKAAYPKAEAVPMPTPNPNVQQPWFPLQAYRLAGQTVGPMKDCRLEFRLFDGELYDIQILCQQDKDKVAKYLQDQFGPPTKTQSNALFWIGTHGSISYAPKNGVFSFQDAVRIQAVQSAMLKAMGKAQAPPQAPTPASGTPETKAE